MVAGAFAELDGGTLKPVSYTPLIQLRVELAVGKCHLAFVFKIRNRTQTLYEGSCVFLLGVVRQQTAEGFHLDVWQVSRCPL